MESGTDGRARRGVVDPVATARPWADDAARASNGEGRTIAISPVAAYHARDSEPVSGAAGRREDRSADRFREEAR